MKTYRSHSLEETAHIAGEWLAEIRSARKDDEALTVGLTGHLGAGKTAFVKAVAEKLGVRGEVTSPTFVIMKIYETKDADFPRLVHLDAYRLERREELEAVRWEDIVSDPNNLVMLEWPEQVGLASSDLDMLLEFEIRDGAYTVTLV